MDTKKISLSIDNLKRIPLDKYEQNFTFIVDGKSYPTSRFLADLLSPIISKYHYQDETIDTFTINTNNLTNSSDSKSTPEKDHFADFLNLATFKDNFVKETELKYYLEYFLQLGNFEEYFNLQQDKYNSISTENVIDHIISIEKVFNGQKIENIKMNTMMNKLKKYSSEHFYELDKEKLTKMSIENLSQILSSTELRVENEDSLLEFILQLYIKDEKYSPLFEYVYYENLSDEMVEKFINEFNIDLMTHETWRSIGYRLVSKFKREQKCERYLKNESQKKECNVLSFEPDSNNKLHGIFRHLTEEAGGNIHDKGIIEITSNSYQGESHHPKCLVDYDKNNYYASSNVNDVQICFDFKNKKIQPTSYSIQSFNYGQNYCHLRNWVFEVSNDKTKWDVIDEHSNDSTLNGNSITATFNVKQTNSFYRYIRLRQTGLSWHESHLAYFPYFEIYGKLKLENSN